MLQQSAISASRRRRNLTLVGSLAFIAHSTMILNRGDDVQGQNLFRRMLFNDRKSGRLVALLPIIMVIEAAFSIGLAHLFKEGIDRSFFGAEGYVFFAYGLILVIFLNSTLGYVRNRVRGTLSEKATADLRYNATKQFAFLPIRTLETMHSGDSLSKLTNDLQAVKRFLDLDGYLLLARPLTAFASLVYMMHVSWQLSLACIIFIPILMVATIKISTPLQAYNKSLQEELANVNTSSQDILGGMEIVKAFNLQEKLSDTFAFRVNEAVHKGQMIAARRALLSGVSTVLTFLPFLMPFALGSFLINRGIMSIGGLLAFTNLLNNLTWPLGQVPNHYASYKGALAALARLYEIIDLDVERTTGKGYTIGASQIVEFSGVDFAYKAEPVLQDLTFSISRGERVAIVGPSGGGKSTIFKLITGFYQQNSGEIRLFGQPVEDWNLEALRTNIAVVSQDTFLFPITIKENIALGRNDLSMNEIILAAQKANIHEFVMSLPEQYNTLVGERGATLSGGQKQRIAIARAILHDTELLLLDEATSALDTESEYVVQQALERAMDGRTTIVIAHRLSTIQNADRIFVLDQGKIVEAGTHAELIAQAGTYTKLYQTSGVA